MRLRKTLRIFIRLAREGFLALLLAGGVAALLLGFSLYKTERIIASVNADRVAGKVSSAESLIRQEEASYLYRLRERFSLLRDGRMKFARCRVEYAAERFSDAVVSCLNAAREVRSAEENSLVYFYAAVARLNGMDSVAIQGGSASREAIELLKQSLMAKSDPEAQALLSALLEAAKEYSDATEKGRKEGLAEQRSRKPRLFNESGAASGGEKSKGY